MKKGFPAAAFAAAIALTCTGTTGVALAKSHTAKTAAVDNGWRETAAKSSITDIRDLAAAATVNATSLQATIRVSSITDAVLERQQLNQLRDEINEMGRHVVALDADRANLSSWETTALDRVTPMVQHAASTLTDAILYSKENPTWVGGSVNRDYAVSIEKDMHQIRKSIDEYLHYDKTQHAAKHAEQQLPVPVVTN